MKRDLISFSSWTARHLSDIFLLAHRLKRKEGNQSLPLAGKTAALIFEKQSLRTRVSFEVGIAQLGGHPIFLQQETIGIATRESVHDVAVGLSRYCDVIVARTLRHQTVVQLAESATVPVINALTDLVHPCQLLADVMTLQELGRFTPSTKLVFLGDGGNIANSWLELAEKLPLHLVLSCPSGYEPHPAILEQALAAGTSTIELIEDPFRAVEGADLVYTDVWPNAIGSDISRRVKVFKPYRVNAPLLKHAKPDCLVMHRLPANRGEEITHDVLDGDRSIALQQSENRLHVQKATMVYLLQ